MQSPSADIISLPPPVSPSYKSSHQGIQLEEVNVGIEFDIERLVEKPKLGMEFNSLSDVYNYYSVFAWQTGFAVAKRTSRKGNDNEQIEAKIECNRSGKVRSKTSNLLLPRPTIKVGCKACIITRLCPGGKWRLTQVHLDHNHDQSPGKVRHVKSNRKLDEGTKRKLELNDLAGIRPNKTYKSLQLEAGGSMLSYNENGCRNHIAKVRRLRLIEEDAAAMHHYFIKMQADNSDFFYALDLDDEGRLINVFWADARSRAACKEFGDVVTFDTTYLVNKYDMPFAPFVGVNHHGQSILLGFGLISNEDTDTFVWLFDTWKACMLGRAPNAIITDQCMEMKNAIEKVFPDTRHRWCIWHIMKKVPEKLKSCNDYGKISWCMRKTVYDSLTPKEFEASWAEFVMKYKLERNEWLHRLYNERKRWVPAYVKDVFWAGMSSTQRSESMNAYFDGYINGKTTLKQFVEQYENALNKKVENENEADNRSWNSVIRAISDDKLEAQFQSVYTHDKVRELQVQFSKKMNCLFGTIFENEYEVKEWIYSGEEEEKIKKRVSFKVTYNPETNDAYCNCRLFEYKGMVCTHQVMVWSDNGIERVPEKYVLRRWSKNVKRAHTKIRIGYDKSSKGIEAKRHDFICKLYKEIAYLVEGDQEKFDMVVLRGREMKSELVSALGACGSHIVDDLDNDRDDNNLLSILGVGDLPSKPEATVRDPYIVRRKGRPPEKRIIGKMEKICTQQIKKLTTKEKRKKSPTKKTKNKKLSSNSVEDPSQTHSNDVLIGGCQTSYLPGAYVPSYPGYPLKPTATTPSNQPHVYECGYDYHGQQLAQYKQKANAFAYNHASVQIGSHPSFLEHPNQLWRGPQPTGLEHSCQNEG